MTHRRWYRIALGYLVFSSVQLGVWALLAPQSFYDSFPGMGRTWIAIDGPYNEHLVRDFGALNLALAVVLLSAAISLTVSLVRTAALASLAWGIPHFLYHLFNTDDLSSGDLIASLGGLLLFAALPTALLILAPRHLGDGVEQAKTGSAKTAA